MIDLYDTSAGVFKNSPPTQKWVPVSWSNSHIIHVAMVVGPHKSVSLTGVMFLPCRNRQADGQIKMPAAAHPSETQSCVKLILPLLPPCWPHSLFSVSCNSVQKISHHKNTDEGPVNIRLMLSVYAV